MSIERRSLLGAIAGASSLAANLLHAIILVPVLLHAWGEERYGVWLGLTGLMAIVVLLDTSHQVFLGGEFQKLYAVDRTALRRVLGSGLRISICLGLTEVLLAAALAPTDLLPEILGVSPELYRAERLDLAFVAMVGIWVLPGSIGGVLVKLYAPAGLFARGQWWGTAFRIAQTGAVALVALLSGSILLACCVSSGTNLLMNVALYIELRRRFPEFWPFWRDGSWREGLRNFSRSLALVVTSTVQQLSGNWLLLLVSSVLGAQVTAIFGTLRTVANTFQQGVQIIGAPLIPEIVQFHVRREQMKVRAAISTCWWALSSCVNVGMLIALPFVEIAYLHWTSGRLAFERDLYLLLAWSVCVRAIASPLLNFLTGINHLKGQFLLALAQGVVVFGLASLLVRPMGLAAFGLAIAAGEVISLLVATHYVRITLRESDGDIPWAHLVLSIASSGIVAVSFALSRAFDGSPSVVAIGVTALAVLHFIQWRLLPIEVRSRLLRLLPGSASPATPSSGTGGVS